MNATITPADLAPVIDGAPQYVDPYPGRKGTDRIYWTCTKCAGDGSVSWGVDLDAAVRNPDGSVRIVHKVCFDCNGTGQGSHLVSSARSTARRQVKEAIKRAKDAARFIAEHEAREAQEAADLATTTAEYTAAHPDVVAALPAMPGDFGASLREQFAATGTLTERQAAAVLRIAAERDAEPDASPVIEGKIVITGKVMSTKWQDNAYSFSGGGTLKMVVLDDRGFRIFGTVPARLDITRGDRVTFTATVTQSNDDPAFGFYSRPSKASKI